MGPSPHYGNLGSDVVTQDMKRTDVTRINGINGIAAWYGL
jgi:hypothetical protein